MNVFIEWEGGVPEPLASIYAAMAGDRGATLHAARLLWGDELVDGFLPEADKKAGRVDDMLDGHDALERIEARLDAVLSRRTRRPSPSLAADEMSSADAATYLGVSLDTLGKLFRAGELVRRNASPPGSGKPRYRYRLADLDRVKREGYQRFAQPPAKPHRRAKRSSTTVESKHLDLD
jgi:hypothetical protein